MTKHIKIEKKREVLSLVTDIAFADVPCWYGVGRRNLVMDLILPKNREGHAPCPAIVWICGGAYMVVDKSVWMPEMMRFAEAGYVVAGIEYRTSNEVRFPAPLMDCKAAVRYLKAHAADYCIDPDRIYAMGESAGGTMASLLGTTAGVPEFEAGDFTEYDSSVRAVVDFYGLVDIAKTAMGSGPSVPGWALDAFLGDAYSEDDAKRASVVNYVDKNTVPFMIVHGSDDPMVPIAQSRKLYEVLDTHQVPVELVEVEGAIHGDDRFYQDEMIERILAFLKKY